MEPEQIHYLVSSKNKKKQIHYLKRIRCIYIKNLSSWTFAQGTLPAIGDLVVKRLNTEAGLEELKNEVKMLGRLDHPNIIRMLGSCIKNNEMVVCYEYMSGGSLDAVLSGMY